MTGKAVSSENHNSRLGIRGSSKEADSSVPAVLNNRCKTPNGGIGCVGSSVVNAQGNIELTKKNNLKSKNKAKTVVMSTDKENKENVVAGGSGGGGNKQLRFSSVVKEVEVTPPPKDFRRAGSQRRSLRAGRCLSTVVTVRERMEAAELLAKDSPKPPTGIVKSLCRLYSEKASSSSTTELAMVPKRLNRSSSFSAALNKAEEEQEKSLDSPTTSMSAESELSSPDTPRPAATKKTGLFRSWSLRATRSNKQRNSPSPTCVQQPKRCSPSCSSTKSADSGFSDSGESNNGAVAKKKQQSQPAATKVVNVDDAIGLEAATDSSPPKTESPTNAGRQLGAAVGNIASLQEGLRLKAQLCEAESVLDGRPFSKSASNLLRADDSVELDRDKARKQFYFSEIRRRYQEEERLRKRQDAEANDVSFDVPAFSTPVRASFRSRDPRPRPRTSIEGARTPSKVESRLRLREMKARSQERNQQQRWSGVRVHDRSEIPSGIEPSLVAVWSQFLDYEASVTSSSSASAAAAATSQTPTVLRNRRDLTQLSDVTASLMLGSGPDASSAVASPSSPTSPLMESFGKRRTAPLYRTGGAALLAGSAVPPPMPSAGSLDQSTLISSAVDAIIELENSDCSLRCPADQTALAAGGAKTPAECQSINTR